MPTYEYRCEACQYELEVRQRISDDPLSSCPKCEGKLKKLISSHTNFMLIGDGWESNEAKGVWHNPKKGEQ